MSAAPLRDDTVLTCLRGHQHTGRRCPPCAAIYAVERRLVVLGTREVGPWTRPLPQRPVDRDRWSWYCRNLVQWIEAARLEGSTP